MASSSRRWRWATPAVLLLMLLAYMASTSSSVHASDLDGFDDSDVDERPSSAGFGDVRPEERQQFATKKQQRRSSKQQGVGAFSDDLGAAADAPGQIAGFGQNPVGGSTPPVLPFPFNLVQKLMPSRAGPAPIDKNAEVALTFFFLLYVVNLGVGRWRNRKIANAFVRRFVSSDGKQLSLFQRNFAEIKGDGTPEGPLMVESMSQFKLYASGRRFCQYLIATVNLRARQDLITQVWYLLQPAEDTLYVEVAMADGAMPPLVLAAAVPRVARRMVTELKDVAIFTHRVTASPEQLPGWPTERVHILAEHSAVAYDLLSDPRVAATLAADSSGARLFRSLHFSSELISSLPGTDSSAAAAPSPFSSSGVPPTALPPTVKNVLRFEFVVPAAGGMEALAGLMALVPLLIDAVGSYKLTPDMKRRALEQRQKVEERAAKERGSMEDKLAKKREEKALAEKEKLARMTPEARAKALEKQDRRDRERQMKKHTRKM